MDSKSKMGLEIIGVAVMLGIIGDYMLRATPWGFGAFLWLAALALCGYVFVQRWRNNQKPVQQGYMLLVLALALLFLWRDASWLKFINTLALLTGLALIVRQTQMNQLREHVPTLRNPPGLFEVGFKAILALPPLVFRGINWKGLTTEEHTERAWAIGRGIVLAMPLLFGFGWLLLAADAAFEALVVNTFDIDLGEVPGHFLFIILFAWIVGSFLLGMILKLKIRKTAVDDAEAERRFTLGIVEIGVMLGLVNGLFAVFVMVQASYLFGGLYTILDTDGLTMAQYARRGFFELVTVAALALPLLLVLRRVLRVEAMRDLRVFHGLMALHVGLLFLILGSAGQRMWLYQQAYGLTELRLYVSASILWLTVVLGWFLFSVIRDRVEHFVPGMALAGFVIVVGLNVLNPDALIVKTNIARALEGKPFDPAYATSLSADAVPALLNALPKLGIEHQRKLAKHFSNRWHLFAENDWRTWSHARWTAQRSLSTHDALLHQMMSSLPLPAPQEGTSP